MTPNQKRSKALYAAHVVFTARAMRAMIVEELVLYVGTDDAAVETAARRYGRRHNGAERERSLLPQPTRLVFRDVRQVWNLGTYGANEVAALRDRLSSARIPSSSSSAPFAPFLLESY